MKYEEVLRIEYRDLAEDRASIREFLEKTYNKKRLHSALGYQGPGERITATIEESTRKLAAGHVVRSKPVLDGPNSRSSSGCSEPSVDQ